MTSACSAKAESIGSQHVLGKSGNGFVSTQRTRLSTHCRLADRISLLKQTSVAEVIRAVKEQFARHRMLFLLQSDGGSQFVYMSRDTQDFVSTWGFMHTLQQSIKWEDCKEFVETELRPPTVDTGSRPGGSGWTVAAAKSHILKAYHKGPTFNGTTTEVCTAKSAEGLPPPCSVSREP